MEWVWGLAVALVSAAGAAFVTATVQSVKISVSERKLEALLKASNRYTIIWKSDLSYIHVNDALRNRLYSLGRNPDANFILSIFGNEKTVDNFTPSALLVAALNENGVDSVFSAAEGENCYVKWRSETVEVKKTVVLIISEGIDETEMRYVKSELYEQRRRNYITEENFDMAMESAEIGIIYISVDELPRVEISEGGKKMLGFSDNEELMLDDLARKVYSVDLNSYQIKLKNLLSGISDTLEAEIKLLIKNNDYHSFMLKWRGVKDESGNVTRITGAFIDVTNQRERYNLYDGASLVDPMSGLLNRRGFMDKGSALLSAIDEVGGNAVMSSIKIERMMKINSIFGNDMWERLIKCYAEGLVKFSSEKTVIGRLGTDDFALIMGCKEPRRDIERLTKELLLFLENSCNDNILPANLKDQVRFDAGVCVYDGVDDVQTLYYKANIMLYASDDIGKEVCHYYDDSVEKKIHDRELIEYEIVSALKHSEFELYYQPKISFKTGEIIGAEALIRWNHPKRGLIQPYEFIPIAEDVGIIMKIDEWGLRQACNQNKYWQIKGYKPIKVSVNISKVQLYKTDIVKTIKHTLMESNLDPKYFEVEITETMAVQDIEHTIDMLRNIKKLGVSVSMDDFGTGYSSLSAIKQLPIDVLKVDRSLIYDICENPASEKIAQAIIEMGKAMKFRVVAEGVETQEQWDILQRLGYDEAQGYFHGKPLATADLERQFFMQ
ncbi:MAG: EAL domain-containing protein [Oscillospiraceae bacterium]|jgi:predicted signal transduction protein with EAL and GGDEF domain|nr:EAL domain-containing protein [Oscillospiraceae bacterium]